MDEQRQDDQLESIDNSSVSIQDIALNTSWGRGMIETGGERDSDRSTLEMQYDDDDDILLLIMMMIFYFNSFLGFSRFSSLYSNIHFFSFKCKLYLPCKLFVQVDVFFYYFLIYNRCKS